MPTTIERAISARKSARAYAAEARRALNAGNYVEARRLAIEGESAHPQDVGLRQLALALAPPTSRSIDSATHSAVAPSFALLREVGPDHIGKWVAIHEGKLLGAAPTL